jgi:hypothetical protein
MMYGWWELTHTIYRPYTHYERRLITIQRMQSDFFLTFLHKNNFESFNFTTRGWIFNWPKNKYGRVSVWRTELRTSLIRRPKLKDFNLLSSRVNQRELD